MVAPNAFTPAEDTALVRLLHAHGADWEAHLRNYSALNNRSPGACLKHLWYTNYYGMGGSMREALLTIKPVEQKAWPKPGKRIFFDDPRAEGDHGSPGPRIFVR